MDEPDKTVMRWPNVGPQWEIAATWKVLEGRPEVVALELRPPDGVAITGVGLRKLPLGQLLDMSRRKRKRSESLGAERFDDERLYEAARTADRRGRPLTDEHLRAVARIWYRAHFWGDPTTVAVARELGIPHSTAEKRVASARRKGFLDERLALGGDVTRFPVYSDAEADSIAANFTERRRRS